MTSRTRQPGGTHAPPAISTAELRRRLRDEDLALVDTRPLAAYNGWRCNGEPRGGHLPGAVAFPSTWLRGVDDAEIDALLEQKRITPGRRVAVYGDTLDAAAFAARLLALGRRDVAVYADGFGSWSADPALPLERLPNYFQLVHPGWLRDVLQGARPEASPAGRVLVFHVNFGAPEEYAERHIPGALYLDTNWLESPADWNRRTPAELDQALRSLGITADTTVVVYGRDGEGEAQEPSPGRRAGQIAATRAALILCYAGVDDVRLLDGGFDAWVGDGNPVETTPRQPVSVPEFGAQIPRRPEVIVDIHEAKGLLADPHGSALVSVRTWREHIGAVSGYDYVGPAGRIAGDVWGNGGTDVNHMQHYRNADNTMRTYPEIASNWAAAGITPDKRVAFYCGTGWRASEAWFCAWLQGWPHVAVYDGGWYEWSRDPVHNRIEVGEPQDKSAA